MRFAVTRDLFTRDLFTRRPVTRYYSLTALVAARGLQTFASAVIAAAVAAFGVISVLALTSSATWQLPGGRWMVTAIFIWCCVAALMWLRRRWPTRTESAFFAGVSTIAILVGCILPVNPFYGILGAIAFAFLIGYTALFHGLGLLTYVLTVATATVLYTGTRIARESVAVGLTAVIVLLLLNVFALLVSWLLVQLTGTDEGPSAVEPLTGLHNRDSFYERSATLLGSRNRRDDRYLVVVVVDIDNLATSTRGRNKARIAVGQALREIVRHNAILGHVGETEYIVADVFTTPEPSPLVQRIQGAIASYPAGTTASIGVVATPILPLVDQPPDDVLDEVIGLATAAVAQARGAGGNQARYVVQPDLSILAAQNDTPDVPPT